MILSRVPEKRAYKTTSCDGREIARATRSLISRTEDTVDHPGQHKCIKFLGRIRRDEMLVLSSVRLFETPWTSPPGIFQARILE